MSKANKTRHVNTENRVVVTRGEGAQCGRWGEEAKMVKRDQMYSEGWKLNFWWWACCGYTEVEINVVYLKLI